MLDHKKAGTRARRGGTPGPGPWARSMRGVGRIPPGVGRQSGHVEPGHEAGHRRDPGRDEFRPPPPGSGATKKNLRRTIQAGTSSGPRGAPEGAVL
jgi:hypothetical protein